MTYQLLDLFSGIGGFSLGLERTGGFKAVAFCEIEEFPRRVLKKHWPEVPCYHDIRELTAERLGAHGIEVEAICGGFPCQGISHAGKRRGLYDERSSLWREFARLIGELRPRVVFVENSERLRACGLGRVLGDLAALGYDATWDCIPAASVGALHIRDRIWITADLADAESGRRQQCWGQQFAQSGYPPRNLCERFDQSEPPRMANGIPKRMDRNRALGNAVVPQIPELIGRAWLASRHERAA